MHIADPQETAIAIFFAFLPALNAYCQSTPTPSKCSPSYTYAQMLIDQTLARHSELVSLVLHTTPPGTDSNIVLASNTWLNGTDANADDIAVAMTGKTFSKVDPAAHTVEIEVQLPNATGVVVVGSIGAIYRYDEAKPLNDLITKTLSIRNEFAKHILDTENLLEPYPYDSQIPVHTYAEGLVEQAFADNSDLLLLSIHATPPNRSSSVILASNTGRIGKPDIAKDEAVAQTGKPDTALRNSGRAQVVVPMHDTAGHAIGVLNMLLMNADHADAATITARAMTIRDRLAKAIPSVDALFQIARN